MRALEASARPFGWRPRQSGLRLLGYRIHECPRTAAPSPSSERGKSSTETGTRETVESLYSGRLLEIQIRPVNSNDSVDRIVDEHRCAPRYRDRHLETSCVRDNRTVNA